MQTSQAIKQRPREAFPGSFDLILSVNNRRLKHRAKAYYAYDTRVIHLHSGYTSSSTARLRGVWPERVALVTTNGQNLE